MQFHYLGFKEMLIYSLTVIHYFLVDYRPRVRKLRYWGEMLLSPIHCCDVTKPPYLLSGELCTSPLHSNRLYVYNVYCRRGGQCFSVLRTRHTDVVGDSSGRSYVTEQGHNVPLLRTRAIDASFLAGVSRCKSMLCQLESDVAGPNFQALVVLLSNDYYHQMKFNTHPFILTRRI